MPYCRVSVQDNVGVMELELPIIVDASEFDRLNEMVVAAADGQPGGRWVLDLSNVKYIGSAMLGLMVNVRQRIKSGGGKLVLCGLSAQLGKAMAACSLHTLFVMTETRAQAVRIAAR